ncbi:hypothetical protein [Acidocella sp.]|uniref:hypothetical protein n=1 Tax=Acidocella sp. TaxID=50710 RepID=UPI002637E674|nr:hypothetical protein [Acidocella sp.]
MKPTVDAVCAAAARRRNVLCLLGVGALTLALPQRLVAEEAGGSGGGSGSGGHGGGGSGSGGHSGGGSGSGGHEGGGEGGSGNKGGKTPAQRAVQHRQRTGRTLGGGESHGGETGDNHCDGGGGSGEGESTEAPPMSEGSTTGPVGGESGGEHFIHQGQGGWGADTKVLRDN